MNKRDRQRLGILIVLLVVLGATVVLGYRVNRPQITAIAQTPETRPPSPNQTTPSDARIRLDLIEKLEASQEIGRNNVFQYREGRPSTQASRPGLTPPAAPPPPGPAVVLPPPPSRPAGPPPPTPIPLKYQGFAIVNSARTAFLADDFARHYNVIVGEVLMGKYRVSQITDTIVEIEDLEANRKQTLPLLK
jgi:hypothetical protein